MGKKKYPWEEIQRLSLQQKLKEWPSSDCPIQGSVSYTVILDANKCLPITILGTMRISIYKFVIHNHSSFFSLLFRFKFKFSFKFDLDLFIIDVTMMSFQQYQNSQGTLKDQTAGPTQHQGVPWAFCCLFLKLELPGTKKLQANQNVPSLHQPQVKSL